MTAKNKQGKPINYCEMPSDVRSAKEAVIYRAVLRCHCSQPDKANANHKCCGQITINEKTITMTLSEFEQLEEAREQRDEYAKRLDN